MSTIEQKERLCDEIARAAREGNLGEVVANHEKLILHYYTDVQEQAEQSFDNALRKAKWGFLILALTVVYILASDFLSRVSSFIRPAMKDSSITISVVGVISGAVVEFTAAVAFWLYSRGAAQFSAFHICLERTHRYLLAYQMVEKLSKDKRDGALHELVCIMANAPMITLGNIEGSAKERPRARDAAGATGGDAGEEAR
jgi:hypothetical protein